jgi:alkanesulfonate monooxygenase SsuD/methylene tetrahydromethanopterin reductase-like flavin-dependent oxidoreductase (luciferase family)
VQIPNNEPLLVIPAMAAVTKHLGFVATFSTPYEPPFTFARRASTLDHLTKGRFGWNVVTSYLPGAARNFGLGDELDHAQRYDRADEYLRVLYKLWEGSWDDDAVVRDTGARAEAVFVGGSPPEDFHATIADIHERAAQNGRAASTARATRAAP